MLFDGHERRDDLARATSARPSAPRREVPTVSADTPGVIGTALSFRAVNGWRGPGAIAIAVGHFSVATQFISYKRLLPMPLLVDFFFVLSGLLIAQNYAQKLSRVSAFPEYVVRRFGRIWPLQAATLGLLVTYELVKLALQTVYGLHFSSPAFSPDGYNLIQAIPTNLLLVHALGIHNRETWDFPSWSLSVELATYISFAAFCLIAPVMRRVLIILTIGASLAVLMFVAPYHMRSTFDYGVFRCFAGFFAGTLCYDAARQWHRPTWRVPTIVELAALALVIAWMTLSTGTILVFAAPFVFCAFILGFVSERGVISRLLLTKPFQFLAELSFAIYMMHAVVLILVLAALHEGARIGGYHLFMQVPNPLAGNPGAPATVEVLHAGHGVFEWSLAVVYLSMVLLASYLAHLCVEVPGRAYFLRVAKRISLTPRSAPIASVRVEPMEPAP